MEVDAVVTADGNALQPGTAPAEVGDRIGRVLALCNDAETDPPWGDPMEIALLEAVGEPDVEWFRTAHLRIAAVPFDSDRKRMTTVNRVGDGRVIAVKGAPETVLERCTSKVADGGESMLEPCERERILEQAGELARSGARVLALADAELGDEPLAAAPDEADLTFLALVALRDPVRPEAANAVSEGAFAGIRILMVTGDHPGTALAVAQRVGLAGPSGRVLTGADIRRTGLPPDPTEVPVYARVDPDEKLAITAALQERGEVVAVTGDGVNDAPALRRADIGVAMGRSGSDVAREAADMVVTDDNLATIVEAVREGRGIYENIRKVVEYLVAGNLSEILVVTAGLLFFPGLGVPLFPLQLLWINLLTDGFPALALGVDPVDPAAMARPPRAKDAHLLGGRTLARLLARATLIASASIGGLVVARYVWDEPWAHARATMFTVLVVAHLLYAFAVRRSVRGPRLRRNTWLVAAVAGGLLLQALVVSVPAMRELFGTAALSFREWVLVVVAGMLPVFVMTVRPLGRGARANRSVRP
jgi:Ca2+-transporting ATPase